MALRVLRLLAVQSYCLRRRAYSVPFCYALLKSKSPATGCRFDSGLSDHTYLIYPSFDDCIPTAQGEQCGLLIRYQGFRLPPVGPVMAGAYRPELVLMGLGLYVLTNF